jgi:hypothetical protein
MKEYLKFTESEQIVVDSVVQKYASCKNTPSTRHAILLELHEKLPDITIEVFPDYYIKDHICINKIDVNSLL